jgi:hypothetical protein
MQTDEVVVVGFRNIAQCNNLIVDKSHIGSAAHRTPKCGNGYHEYGSQNAKEYVFLFHFILLVYWFVSLLGTIKMTPIS